MMKMKRKTRLAMAVGGAIAGVAASGLVLAQGDDMGQIVTFPYYTVNGGWQTLFNVTNTTSAALAVKVRFHEAQNSRDVLDFNILMSPYDAWTGWVEPLAATGGMVLKTTDNSCTSPVFDGAVGLPAKKAAYTGDFADGGPDTAARLTEGYVELIVMGKCSPEDSCFSDDAFNDDTNKPGIGYLTEHVDGKPRDCTQADKYFEAGDNAWDDTQGVPGTGNPIARGGAAGDPRGYNAIVLAGDYGLAYPLKGNETLLNLANGVAGGNAGFHLGQIIGCYPFLRDDNGNTTDYRSCSGNLVTAQQFPWFLEPTTATAPSGVVWDALGLRDFELDKFNEQSLLNEWSSNPDLGVATDWIVTFSTKGFHVDQFCGQVQANNNRWRYNGSDALTCATPTPTNGLTENDYDLNNGGQADGLRAPGYPPSLTPFKNRWANGMSNIALSYVLYDREEGTRQASGTAPSPAPPATLPQMPYETNVLAFTSVADPNRDGFALPEGSAVASPNPAQIDASAILGGAPNGWMDIVMPCAEDGSDSYPPGSAEPVYTATGCSGLPVTGFMVKTRTFGTPDMHYGQIQNHGYRPGYNYGIGPIDSLTSP
jgi:hypothetical protein